MAEGARLESVFRGNSNVGSNPTLSAKSLKINELLWMFGFVADPLSESSFPFGMRGMPLFKAKMRSVKARTDTLGVIF